MAEPAVQLPDPLQDPSPAAASGSDDLISQMAGKEIERLMADAGVEAPKPEEVASGGLVPEELPELKKSDGKAKPEKDQPIGVALPPVEPKPEAMPHAPEANPTPAITKELDQVFEQQLSDAAAPVAAAAIAPEASEPPAEPPPSISTDGVNELLGRLDAGERPPPPEPSPVAVEPTPAAEAAPPQPEHPVEAKHDDHPPVKHEEHAPESVAKPAKEPGRIMIALARVLDPFPDDTRDLIGKIAIITAINAIAVLVYVYLFRR